MRLTDSIARNAKPAAKTVRMFDRDGLYLEISPRGGKWWRLKYRYAGRRSACRWASTRVLLHVTFARDSPWPHDLALLNASKNIGLHFGPLVCGRSKSGCPTRDGQASRRNAGVNAWPCERTAPKPIP